MGTRLAPVRRDSTDELHPRIYAALIGLTIWLVLSVWVLFSRSSYVGLSDSIITLFFAVFVGIPVMLWLSWRHNAEPQDQNREAAPFGEWAANRSRPGPAALAAVKHRFRSCCQSQP